MRLSRRHALLAGAAAAGGCTSFATTNEAPFSLDDRIAQVRAAETAFAKTMADRDLQAFARFVADDAVFVNGGKPLRGKAAIVEHWKRFFVAPAAPFAWRPALVEVLATGGLGYSEGPVSRPDGKVVATYYSTWRRNPADGSWQVVFDNGYDVCDCPK